MEKTYNQIAGGNLSRLESISDGIFAFSMTLLIAEIHVPTADSVHDEHGLWQALVPLFPRVLTWLMSFLTLGIFWVGQQTQLNHLKGTNRDYTWLHLSFLAAVTAIPFSTRLLAEFIAFRTALLVYWLNLFLLGLLILWSWNYACGAGLVKEELKKGAYRAIRRRVLSAQALYAFGAALCAVNNYWSIGFIVLIQVNYVLAPKLRFLNELTS